jgi:O6-methylguanine-DNA--protein-cysteine methyltransferase
VSRTLKRPMFRRGGTVNDGIMTGLTDRKQLKNGTLNPEMIRGTTQNILSAMDEFAPMPKTRLPIGQFGLDIATGTPIGEALKSGYKTFTTQDDMRRAAMAKRKQAAVSAAISSQMNKKNQSVLMAEKEARAMLPRDATPDQIRKKTAELLGIKYGPGKTYGPEANLERAINSYRGTYGDGSKAFNHASFDVKVAPALRAAGKNPRSNIKFKDGKYKTKGKSPGVYIDVENGKVIEFDGNVAVELKEYTALLK